MNLKTLVYSSLLAIVVFFGQTHADIVTIDLDSIPSRPDNAVSNYSISSSFVTLSMFNPQTITGSGFIEGIDNDGNRGLVLDYNADGSEYMWAVDTSFDRVVQIIGYSISIGTDEFDTGDVTLTFGNVGGLDGSQGDYTLQTPINLSSGQTMRITESSLDGPAAGYSIISSITVEAIPEPSAFLFLALGGLALSSRRERK